MKKQISIFLLPLIVAGCTSTNPKSAFNDVNKTVNARLGQNVQWRNTNEVTQSVASLLQTNLTAQSAVTIALLNNKALQAQFEEIGISQAELAQASRLHNIELAGSWRFPNRPPSAVDAEYSASADFLDLLTLPARKKVAARNLEQTKVEVADKVLQLAADAQTAFYQLQAQMELVKRLETIVEVNDAQVDVAQRQYDAGNINDAELHNQQAASNQSHLDLMRSKAEVKANRERVNRLLGLSGEQIGWQIADELPGLPEKEMSLENLESLAVNQRLDLAAERQRAESIAAALRLKKKTRFIPGITIGVDTERSPDGQRVTGPTLDLELPIFDQGQPAVAKLTAQFQQAKNNYTAREITVRSEVREARDALLAAREAAEFSQKNLLPLRRQILRDTLLQYNAMQKGNIELLAAKEREQNSEQTNVEALRDYWLTRVELERSLGGKLEMPSPPMPRQSQPESKSESKEHEHHHE
jgi:cobalt-zinc-cadmium efflux system outer membrane protein